MNPRERRAAAAKKETVGELTAYHEAGHALGRYLAAPEMGIPIERAIRHIDLPRMSGTLHPTGEIWVIQAETVGATLPPEIDVAYRAMERELKIPIGAPLKRKLIDKLSDKFDRDRWLTGRARIAVGAAVTEGLHQRKQGGEVFREAQCRHDAELLHLDCQLVCLENDFENRVNAALKWWYEEQLFQKEGIRDAVKALAIFINSYRRPHKIPGNLVIDTIEKAIRRVR